MSHVTLSSEEPRRRAVLGELALDEAQFDPARSTALAAIARLLQTRTGWAIASLAFCDVEACWTACAVGAGGPPAVPPGRDFLLLALQSEDVLEIADTRLDPRVTGGAKANDATRLTAYAGSALRVGGCAIGTLCVTHAEPGRLDAAAVEALRDLALTTQALLEAQLGIARLRTDLSRGRDASLAGSDWLWESNAEGFMTWVSDSAELHTGEPAAAEIGRLGRTYNAAPGEPYQASYEAYLRARAERRPYKDAIAARATPRGRLLISMSGQPIFDATGRFMGYRGAARDVTADMARRSAAEHEQRAAEDALRDKSAAELASAAKSEFLSRMSHEMRTPLNAVIGFAQLMQMRGEAGRPVPLVKYSGHILQSGRHLLSLVNDVLDLQQVEAGRLTLALEAVDLVRALSSAWQLVEPAARAQKVEIKIEVDADWHVLADPRRLQQVLLNLLSNAVKYNRVGGQVRCSVEPLLDAAHRAGRAALVVEDTGEGLSGDQVARLFQPFERLGREGSAVEGSGLGLVITRALVKEMDGSLTMSSRPGVGSSVRVELPLAPAAATTATPATTTAMAASSVTAAPVVASPPTLRLLYVEDNAVNALLFQEALKMLGGVELRVAPDGPDAFELVRTWQPDVLVLDAHLPSMSGYDVLRRLREMPRFAHTPAFMCSADASPDELQRARDAGFSGYWSKPVDLKQVMQALGALGRPGATPPQ